MGAPPLSPRNFNKSTDARGSIAHEDAARAKRSGANVMVDAAASNRRIMYG